MNTCEAATPLLLWTDQAWLRPDVKLVLPERTQVGEMSDPGTRIFIAMPSSTPARLAAPKNRVGCAQETRLPSRLSMRARPAAKRNFCHRDTRPGNLEAREYNMCSLRFPDFWAIADPDRKKKNQKTKTEKSKNEKPKIKKNQKTKKHQNAKIQKYQNPKISETPRFQNLFFGYLNSETP